MTYIKWIVVVAIVLIIGLTCINVNEESQRKDQCLSTGGKYVTELVGSYPVIVNKVVIMQPKYKRMCVHG
jgi:hypothetical protein